ncbi:sugar phosphate isomerase/epimerase [Agromyces endophyticus]|uniref:sugar phosphate isomerase/epimerase family protein n=1 Tax=Agromyces sp. H17E-10 TaxID=2932244 RepID=UPI001FD2A81E|nr:sugar phosphate isomerase/epimerase [Agromyces sp. H17E-10]UOQ90364.1 sugar phosphate isomerase/epimerase [Agromyces sp. H17E-10]
MCYGHDGEGALRESLARRGVTRRGLLLGALGATAAAATLGAGAAPAMAEAGKKPWKRVPPGKISIQLWTVREALGAPWGPGDYDTTLRAIADAGYPRVEQALGYFGRTAAELRAFYDEIGIQATSSHDGPSADASALELKLENAATLGQRYLNVPYFASNSLADWQQLADTMNEEARAAKGYGIAYGYHNHAHEFTTDLGGGLTPWQVLTERLDPALVHLEADLYWVVTGGIQSGDGASDPEQFAIDVIDQAPQRVRQFHVKDRHLDGDMADLGTGTIDFARIFRAHAVEEYIVENDTPDVTPLQTARVGYDYLFDLRF